MRTLLSFLLLVITCYGFSQSEQDKIVKVLNKFIDATVYNYPDSIASTFFPNTRMFLYNGSDTAWTVTSEQYASFYTRRPKGTRNNRDGKITAIEIVKDVAYAKLEFDIPTFGNRYNDLLLLKKIKGEWLIVGKCTSAEPIPKPKDQLRPKPYKETILDGLNKPWSMAFISEDEAIISEKDGGLVLVNLARKTKESITGLPTDVARKILIDTTKYRKGVFHHSLHGQERSFNAGWFQVLLDPDFEENNYIYVSYAAENSERASTTKVIRGILDGTNLTNIETLFLAAPYSHGLYHYGGGMIFGNDGKLYISIGERNFYEYLNPVPPLSQDVRDKRGKIIRINSDGSIPNDNPDFGKGAIPGLYATGIRASQGFTINPKSGKIWFSEHGTIQGDELNILKAGANYGWPHKTTGRYRTKDYNPPIIPGSVFTDPIHYWDKTVAPTGLTFYQGSDFPQWSGDLIVPGLSKGSLWRMVIEDDKVVGAEELFIDDRVRLRKAVTSPRGKLYLLTDEVDGKLILVSNEN